MATPNTPILDSDMVALAALANGKSSLSKEVLSGAGSYRFVNCSVVSVGSGYLSGDIITAHWTGVGGTAQIEIVAVGYRGEIVGIKFINRGSLSTANNNQNPPPILYGGNSATGTGAVFQFSWEVNPVNQNYSFAESGHLVTAYGQIRGISVKDGGTNYQIGDVLTVAMPAASPPIQATVTGIGNKGSVTTFSATVIGYLFFNGSSTAATSGGHGSGATFWVQFAQNENPAWQTELTRLRTNLFNTLGTYGVDNYSPTLSVSGGTRDDGDIGWPIADPSLTYNKLSFFYEDTGKQETVTISGGLLIQSNVGYSTQVVRDIFYPYSTASGGPGSGRPGNYNSAYATRMTGAIFIGGTKPVHIRTDIFFQLVAYKGNTGTFYYYGTQNNNPILSDPSSLVSVVKDLGIGTVEKFYYPGSPDYVFVVWHIDQLVSPGRYEATVQGSVSDSSIVPTNFIGTLATFAPYAVFMTDSVSSAMMNCSYMGLTGGQIIQGLPPASVSFPPYNDGTPVNALDGIKNVFKIKCWQDDNPVSPGVFSVWKNCTNRGVYLFPGMSSPWFPVPTGHYTGTPPTIILNGYGGRYYFIAGPNDVSCNGVGGGYFDALDGVFTLIGKSSSFPNYGYTGQIIPYGWLDYPFPQPTFGTEYLRLSVTDVSIIASTWGFWFAQVPPISGLNIPPLNSMPWNIVRHSALAASLNFLYNPMLNPNVFQNGEGAYALGTPLEQQLEPSTWVANKYYYAGFVICDTNGNFWTATSAGYSGTSIYGVHQWPVNLGDTFQETLTGKTGVQWRLTKKNNAALPSTWVENKMVDIGSIVIDWNGNEQTATSWQPNKHYGVGEFVTDSNNVIQQVQTAGTSGVNEPTWNTVLNETTDDNDIVWKLVLMQSGLVTGVGTPDWNTRFNSITQDATVFWKLTQFNQSKTFLSAVGRQNCIPRYPVYWASETIARLKPPTTNSDSELTIWGAGSQWKDHQYWVSGNPKPITEAGWQTALDTLSIARGLAFGWWIYSVAINRLGTLNAKGLNVPQSGAVSVTIGCIRNGAFVAFGTYSTGQTATVLWPVFTSDALVYQCSERVDIQAVAIQVISVGAGVSYPIIAAYYNDTVACLGLIG